MAKKLWERDQGIEKGKRERDKVYERFLAYLDLGEQRSIPQIARILGLTPQAMGYVARTYNWHQRAAAWDKEQRRLAKKRSREGLGEDTGSSVPTIPLPEPPPPPPSIEPSQASEPQTSSEEVAAPQEEPPAAGGGSQSPPPPPPPPGSAAPEPEGERQSPLEPEIVINTLGDQKQNEEYVKGLEHFREIYGRLGYAMALESFELFPTIKQLRGDIEEVMRMRRVGMQANDTAVVAVLSEAINKQIPQYARFCESMINLANAGRQHWGAVVGIEEILEQAYGKQQRKP